MNNDVRLGPAAPAGSVPVRITEPSASTTSRPATMSSIFPYRVENWPAPRDPIHPPTVEMSNDCGKCPTDKPYFSRRVFSRSGPKVPGSTSTRPEISSTLITPASEVISITTPPNNGIAAPHTPERPPDTVIGTELAEHNVTMSLTCEVIVGRQIASARRAVCALSDQCIASGHQSRECSTRSARSLEL